MCQSQAHCAPQLAQLLYNTKRRTTGRHGLGLRKSEEIGNMLFVNYSFLTGNLKDASQTTAVDGDHMPEIIMDYSAKRNLRRFVGAPV